MRYFSYLHVRNKYDNEGVKIVEHGTIVVVCVCVCVWWCEVCGVH